MKSDYVIVQMVSSSALFFKILENNPPSAHVT